MLYKSGEISNFFADALTKFIPFLYFKSLDLYLGQSIFSKAHFQRQKKPWKNPRLCVGAEGVEPPTLCL